MNGAHAEFSTRIRPLPELDLPRVLVASPSTSAANTLAHALRGEGYAVCTAGSDVVRELRKQQAIELLVLDGETTPWNVASALDTVRSSHWALPILAILPPDSALRAEAERLGVETILEAPVTPEQVCRAATRVVPIIPELALDVAE